MSGADPGVTQLAARFAGLRLALSRDEAGRALDEEAPAAEPASAVEAAQLPTAPVEVLAKALRLHGAEDPCSRLRRAWEAGLGARRVLEGRYKRPGATVQAPAGYRNRCYVVLRAPSLEAPFYSGRWAQVLSIVGSPPSEEALFHGWASEAEARAYCAGAGLRELPSRRV